LGKIGHINAVSGLGDWAEGKEILQKLAGRNVLADHKTSY